MECLSALKNCFKIFEIVGLQFFTLNSSDKMITGQHSRCFKLLIVAAWMLILPGLVVFLIPSYIDPNIEKSAISIIVVVVINVSTTTAVILTPVLSFFKNSQLKKFFINAQKTSEICSQELYFNVNYQNLKRPLNKFMIIFLSLYAILIFTLIADFTGSQALSTLLMTVVTLIPIFFTHLIVLRFNFYVQVINFLLNVLKQLVLKNLSKEKDNSAPTQVVTVTKNIDDLQKIIALRKIYILIREMAQIVSGVMGIPILLELIVSTTGLTKNLFTFALIIVGLSDVWILRRFQNFTR